MGTDDWGYGTDDSAPGLDAAAAVRSKLAEHVRGWLGKEGISQKQLANRLGMAVSGLSKKLNGKVVLRLPDLLWGRDLGVTLIDKKMTAIAEQAVREAEYEWRRRNPQLPNIGGRSSETGSGFGTRAPKQRVHPSQHATVAIMDSMRRLSAAHWSVLVNAITDTLLEVRIDVSADVDGSVLPDEINARLWQPAAWETTAPHWLVVGGRSLRCAGDGRRGGPPRPRPTAPAAARPFTAGSVSNDPIRPSGPATLEGNGFRWDVPKALAAVAAWDAY